MVIKLINNKKHDRLRIDERLKVIAAPDGGKMKARIVVRKCEFMLTIYVNGLYLKSYPIGIGREDATPTASFKIVDRPKGEAEKPKAAPEAKPATP